MYMYAINVHYVFINVFSVRTFSAGYDVSRSESDTFEHDQDGSHQPTTVTVSIKCIIYMYTNRFVRCLATKTLKTHISKQRW